ncbi:MULTISPECIES: helix-turn-helix domain-containing protein [unclassified Curtobacterium]|uniref:helix-turn-helix domain-containing protein n=1 Tax=unclassified Curtobacterium TaxID=257496 RepID=UPI0008DEA820|nr:MULTISPECIES: helix-turn-helix transcriptional regulator [unclassified Curtobacterium]OIH99582.1 transcriptional regulator [Curtobacterium sp. MCBA15_003]OII30583.1 transcriptional regulator [Curtobacterium sp. MMLR14_006]
MTDASRASAPGRRNPLGTYLRARRAQVTPAQAGLAVRGQRRVAGLRREEVAMLAGISADYYLRLERGRDRNPSTQVLEALGRVLRLDDEHLAHMHAIVAGPLRADRAATSTPVVPDGARRLLDQLVQPAVIETTAFDVLAANPLAQRLSPRLTPGRNQLRDLLTVPEDRALFPDHDAVAQCLVGNLRQTAGGGAGRSADLAEELRMVSDRFRQLWDRHDVQGQTGGTVLLHHPEVGPLRLERERLAVDGAADVRLVVFHAAPGSDAAAKLDRLRGAGSHRV